MMVITGLWHLSTNMITKGIPVKSYTLVLNSNFFKAKRLFREWELVMVQNQAVIVCLNLKKARINFWKFVIPGFKSIMKTTSHFCLLSSWSWFLTMTRIEEGECLKGDGTVLFPKMGSFQSQNDTNSFVLWTALKRRKQKLNACETWLKKRGELNFEQMAKSLPTKLLRANTSSYRSIITGVPSSW